MTLKPKQQRFVDEYLIDQNATQAYKRAGYKVKSDHYAQTASSRMMLNDVISAKIKAGLAELSRRSLATAEYVLTRLKQNVERAMQIEPIRAPSGEETGEYRYEGAVANKALELLGKHLGLFDKVTPPPPPPGSSPENPLHVNSMHDVDPAALRSFIGDLRRAGIDGPGVGGVSPDGVAESVDPKKSVAEGN